MRLPSRNWSIFLSITGGIAGAITYDKWQTRRIQKTWCDLVSHIKNEPLDTHTMPRRMTVYLAAPPGDGLRSAREHFHAYIKPVLVAAAMDYDVVEGRKEGDVRYKTAERIRRKRKRGGEGEPLPPEDTAVEETRAKNGTHDFEGLAGDLIVGRHTWKEYIRGLHEGWLGPADAPQEPETTPEQEIEPSKHASGSPALGDAAVNAAVQIASPSEPQQTSDAPGISATDASSNDQLEDKPQEEEKKEEEKPKPRQPPPYILPSAYQSATPSALIPELIGPSTPLSFPHILGFRHTPVRMYRFFTRRRLADDIGREVASAILASHRPYSTSFITSEDSASSEGREKSELEGVLEHEESNWLKSVRQPRKEHEESVWIEPMVLDERLAQRFRRFELTSDDEARAKRLAEGNEKPLSRFEEEDV